MGLSNVLDQLAAGLGFYEDAKDAPAAQQLADGSFFKAPLTTILAINPHPNADRMELATVYGFQVCVRKGQYQVGSSVIYVPIDSLLPQWLEDKIFPPDAKVKLTAHRVRQIRLRGVASQGMLLDPSDVSVELGGSYGLEDDVSTRLGITKYEPPVAGPGQTIGKRKQKIRKHEHPLFHKYNGLSNIKWFPTLFQENEQVMIQEKLHGTNARASILPYQANTFFKKLKKLLGMAPENESCYGSNNVDITAATDFKGYYGEDIYGKTFHAMDIFSKIMPGEIVYGEIVGPGIQKNYEYSLKEHKFLVFDVKVLQPDGKFKWMSPTEVVNFCHLRGLEMVPVLYSGIYNKELAYGLTRGKSVFDPNTKVREGIVIKAQTDYDVEGNKKALKWVSEEYLDDKSNSDFH